MLLHKVAEVAERGCIVQGLDVAVTPACGNDQPYIPFRLPSHGLSRLSFELSLSKPSFNVVLSTAF